MSHRRFCCCGTFAGVCVVSEAAVLTCDNDDCVSSSWTVTQTVTKMTDAEYTTALGDGTIHPWTKTANTHCSGWTRAYAYSFLSDMADDCPPAPAAGSPPTTAPQCCICIDGSVSITTQTEQWINGVFCRYLLNNTVVPPITQKLMLCTANPATDWIDIPYTGGYPATNQHAVLQYQPSSGTFRLVTTITSGETDCGQSAQAITDQLGTGSTVEIECDATPAVGEYLDCIGRQLTAEDTMMLKYRVITTATVSTVTCDSIRRFCYHTTRKTCTGGVWVLDSFSSVCLLNADAPTVHDYELVSGTTYEKVEKGAECTSDDGCAGAMPADDPVIACP